MSHLHTGTNSYHFSETTFTVNRKPKTVLIELEPNEKDSVEDDTRWKGFIVKSSAFYFFLHLSLVTASFLYFYDYKIIKRQFKNFGSIGNGYDILFLLVLMFTLFVPSFFMNFSRRMVFVLAALQTLAYWYFSFFILRLSKKTKYACSHLVLITYAILFTSSFGLLIGGIAFKKRFNVDIGVSVSAIVFTLILVVYVGYFEIYDPSIGEMAGFIIINILYTHYLNYDIKFIVRRRSFYYDYQDWILAGIHIQTDLFARFWIDVYKTYTEQKKQEDTSVEIA